MFNLIPYVKIWPGDIKIWCHQIWCTCNGDRKSGTNKTFGKKPILNNWFTKLGTRLRYCHLNCPIIWSFECIHLLKTFMMYHPASVLVVYRGIDWELISNRFGLNWILLGVYYLPRSVELVFTAHQKCWSILIPLLGFKSNDSEDNNNTMHHFKTNILTMF